MKHIDEEKPLTISEGFKKLREKFGHYYNGWKWDSKNREWIKIEKVEK